MCDKLYHFSGSVVEFFVAEYGIGEGEPFGEVQVGGGLKNKNIRKLDSPKKCQLLLSNV